ncbi:flagellar type III secretion system pore protein FliP [Sutcliffiella horikoshii]|uniref:flagellar type III secretion system pore protein FliP n=1 Tax=Sutcliffiella horikoshii TaxID=79883 RepID=UPI00203F1EB7|nr:flagellar type III secretion system pore protein FliP [Sutcliffiella horikoshii]MCM3616248.1 flagellar type III secretion system pore protein FliP [Sutcliffiella horikoshii]
MTEFIDIFNGNEASTVSTSVQLLLLLTVFSLAPAILILMTSFTRIIIVLSFVRTSLATQSMPPNQVLIGLALFLTFFIMAPTFAQVNDQALQPLFNEEIDLDEAYERASIPLKEFMSKHTRQKDLALFLDYAQMDRPESLEDIPLTVLVPAFAISELKTAFQIGFMIFIPFLVIDMVVASVLMSMGMMMLPPVMISLPFKILLFVLVDGWYLIVKSLLQTF